MAYNIYTTTPSTTIDDNVYITASTGINGTYSINDDWLNSSITVSTGTHDTLSVKGDANFEGDLKVNGKSLVEAIENIEKRLAILHPNPELEEKWERLKSLGQMYRELEQEILEKEKVWSILKK